ncbi:MAG TPA: hypothetical protein VEZ11_13070 [Thermoanaerobaculia bacterium]|nr:hypothetical protein [Thermoanaerobaculia bacterium]
MTVRRWLPLVLAPVVYVAAVVIWIGNDPRVAKQAYEHGSTLNTSENGASLAFQYLAHRGAPGPKPSANPRRKVAVLTRALDAARLERDAVVLRLAPAFGPTFMRDELSDDEDDDEETPTTKRRHDPKKKPGPTKSEPPQKAKKPEPRVKTPLFSTRERPLLTDAEDAFVRGGGRLVLAIGGQYGPITTRDGGPHQVAKVFPLWPGLDRLTIPEARTLAGAALRRTHALFVAGEGPVISRLPLGAGDVLLLSAPELLQNKYLALPGNLQLLSALAEGSRPVYFDERVHGLESDDGAIAILKEWRFGPFLLMVVIVTIAIIWRGARAIGAREDPFRDTRSEAVDLVGSLGALYDRSMTNGEAIQLYHQALIRAAAAQTGLRGDALHKRVEQLMDHIALPTEHHLPEDQFQSLLTTINESFRRLEHAKHR